ncbi:uncharacterized protein PITG_02306 [Phytophthora infestans T30-4]|uniref:Uncharacterized protein n=1 Tax=Phytophthora infestans (strain T30-4) TaxID=403677 RepID=D0MW01_PHYIT|nr:uncharacterized protein PITG_02306 [Phytophthora infestans T30-4]EEY63814.1 hypothetical protein PITG_02306 [Phytophthora infestans T30-4]|eukprot:XP_002907250.1 hypothetical protein PITG_02306 [Phytophthora infestans T30-4]
MTTWIETFARAVENGATIYRLLGACRVFMRDQRGIDKLLSAESLDSFMKLAEDGSWSSPLREEALKCMINSVYSRPEFVSETLIVKGLGRLLLEILQFKHPNVSPLTDNLLDLKNKVIEVLMLLPESLLAAFIQQQQQESVGLNDRSLVPVLDHLHSMLLVVRVEKTRPLKEMLPTLIVCHKPG